MVLALVCLLVLVVALAALLVRQIRITRQAYEETETWRRLYKNAYFEHEAVVKKTSRAVRQKTGPVVRPRPAKPAAVQPIKKFETTMAEPLTLILPIQLLSKNARDKLHYQAKNRLRKDYQDIIQIKYPRRNEPTPGVRQRATITRILGPRERRFDQQNVGAGSAIELVDALTASGYWVDDSEKWLETSFEQTSSEKLKGPAVTVEIIELDTR